MLPFENIPDDLVPLTAHFKHLLTYASPMQPLFFFLDSIDQLTGVADKVSWLPTRMPPTCKVMMFFFFFLRDSDSREFVLFFKIILTCANEEANPMVSREYHLLRRLIDINDNFIEVRELGEDLAVNVKTKDYLTKILLHLRIISSL